METSWSDTTPIADATPIAPMADAMPMADVSPVADTSGMGDMSPATEYVSLESNFGDKTDDSPLGDYVSLETNFDDGDSDFASSDDDYVSLESNFQGASNADYSALSLARDQNYVQEAPTVDFNWLASEQEPGSQDTAATDTPASNDVPESGSDTNPKIIMSDGSELQSPWGNPDTWQMGIGSPHDDFKFAESLAQANEVKERMDGALYGDDNPLEPMQNVLEIANETLKDTQPTNSTPLGEAETEWFYHKNGPGPYVDYIDPPNPETDPKTT